MDGGVRALNVASSAAAGEVRSEVKLRLAELGLSGISDDVVLIISELVTNATQYGSGREIPEGPWAACDWEPGCKVTQYGERHFGTSWRTRSSGGFGMVGPGSSGSG